MAISREITLTSGNLFKTTKITDNAGPIINGIIRDSNLVNKINGYHKDNKIKINGYLKDNKIKINGDLKDKDNKIKINGVLKDKDNQIKINGDPKDQTLTNGLFKDNNNNKDGKIIQHRIHKDSKMHKVYKDGAFQINRLTVKHKSQLKLKKFKESSFWEKELLIFQKKLKRKNHDFLINLNNA